MCHMRATHPMLDTRPCLLWEMERQGATLHRGEASGASGAALALQDSSHTALPLCRL